MKTNHRPVIRLGSAPDATSLFLILAGALLLLLELVSCQRSAEADGAISRDTPSAESAPAVAPADTPPAKPAEPAAVGDSAAATTAKPTEAAGDQKAAPEAGAAAKPAGAASGDVANGWKQYEANCSRCHGQDALGSAFAPDLRQSAKTLGQEAFAGIVKKGKVATGMPAFESQLDDQQVKDIYAYVTARAGGLPPGRPKS